VLNIDSFYDFSLLLSFVSIQKKVNNDFVKQKGKINRIINYPKLPFYLHLRERKFHA